MDVGVRGGDVVDRDPRTDINYQSQDDLTNYESTYRRNIGERRIKSFQ